MKSVISTGTSVIDRIDAADHRERLRERQRPEHPAFLRLERNTGTNETMMIASEKKIGARHLLRRADDRAPAARRTRSPASSVSDTCRYAFSTMTIDASTSTPIASASPPSDMMFDVTPR